MRCFAEVCPLNRLILRRPEDRLEVWAASSRSLAEFEEKRRCITRPLALPATHKPVWYSAWGP